MASATVKVALTMITPMQLGTRWRTTTRQRVAPIMVAACTNSSVRRDSTSPRTSLATPIQESSDSRTMISSRLGVNRFTRISSSTRLGTASRVSMTRIMKASTMPPTKPANAPYSVPRTVVATATAKPSSSEERPPSISRPSTS